MGRMDDTIAERAVGLESAVGAAESSTVHKKEITQQVSQNNFGNEQDCERAFSRFLMDVDNSDFLKRTYREGRLKKFAKLVLVTESALSEHDLTFGGNLLVGFWKCRTKAWAFYFPDTDRVKSVSNSCRGRWCPMCAEARVKVIAHNCFEFLRQRDVRFLVLTVKHNDLPLSEQIRRIKKCYVGLTRRVFWKKYVTGSIVFLHVKENEEKTEYHVHLHIFLTGSFVPHRRLKAEWLKVTGDSLDVRIEAAHSEKELGQTIRDYARYAGRPANLLDISAEHRLEVVHAFQGIQACWKTGICRAVSLGQPRYNKGGSKGLPMGRLYAIRKSADAGDYKALRVCFVIDKDIPFKEAPSFWGDEGSNDKPAGDLSPVEPLPPSLFSPNERSPPGMDACHNEGDVLDENAPW